MHERDYESALCARVHRVLKVESIKMNIMNNRGFPDRIFLMPIRPAWVEFKIKGKRPTKLQLYRIQCLSLLGYDVKWSDNYEATYDWLAGVYAARISEAGNQENGRPSVRGAILGSGTWEDVHKSGDGKASTGKTTL